jgi:hypothetical protein
MDFLVLYVMVWATPVQIRRIPMSATACAVVMRQHDANGRWPIVECMPGDWKVGQPLKWDTRYQEARRNVCTPDVDSDCG